MLFDFIFFGSAILIVLVTYYFFSYRKTGNQDTQNQQDFFFNFSLRVPQNQGNQQQQQIQEQNEENEEEEKAEAKTTKQLQKEAKKQEKQQQRQAMLQQLEQKQKKKEEQSKKYDEAQQQREEKERKLEEELNKQIEEQKKKEQEIYNQWKNQFSVEEKGISSIDEENQINLRQNFLKYIKLRKVVKLEDLAGEFKLGISDVIDRIKSFEISGDLFGVFDERGKYIYITMEEMHALKNYISMKGRVSRPDLILECNNLIRLNPSGKDLKQISEEEKEMLHDVEKEFESIKQQMQEEK